MDKRLVVVLSLVVVVTTSGCTGYFLDDRGGYNTESECGYENGPCCEWFGEDEFGAYTGRVYCNDYLECRGDRCVEGPGFESRGRGEF